MDMPDVDAFDGKGWWESGTMLAKAGYMTDAMYDHFAELGPFSNNPLKGTFSVPKHYGLYVKRIHKVCAHRAYFVTHRGYIGLAPWNAKLGDMVFVLKGGKTPFILRRELMDDGCSLVGESYVYGIAGGEALQMGLPELEIRIF